MARRKSKKEAEETLVDIVEVRDQAVNFYEEHQNTIIGIASGVILIIGAFIAYQFFYMAPRQQNAQNAMYKAEYQFSQDSFALALENPGGGEGFLDIIENYGGTDQANTSKYYAGISYLNIGRYEDAISYLESFKAPTDLMKAMKNGALGDAHSELNDMDKAISFYKKAGNASEIESVAPYFMQKLAMLYQYQGKDAEAMAIYKDIKDKYPLTEWGKEAEKFVVE